MGESIRLEGPLGLGYDTVLTPEALDFVAGLHRRFGGLRRELLARRELVQADLDRGAFPGFREDTRPIRESEWLRSVKHRQPSAKSCGRSSPWSPSIAGNYRHFEIRPRAESSAPSECLPDDVSDFHNNF